MCKLIDPFVYKLMKIGNVLNKYAEDLNSLSCRFILQFDSETDFVTLDLTSDKLHGFLKLNVTIDEFENDLIEVLNKWKNSDINFLN